MVGINSQIKVAARNGPLLAGLLVYVESIVSMPANFPHPHQNNTVKSLYNGSQGTTQMNPL